MERRQKPSIRPEFASNIAIIQTVFGEIRALIRELGLPFRSVDESFALEDLEADILEEAPARIWREKDVKLDVGAQVHGEEPHFGVALTMYDPSSKQVLQKWWVSYEYIASVWVWCIRTEVSTDLDLHPRIQGRKIQFPDVATPSRRQAMNVASKLITFFAGLPVSRE